MDVQDKQYRACCRWGMWIQVMTSCRIHMAEGDITLHRVAVSGRLFWLVQRIINPAWHLQLQIYNTSDLFQKSEWLASPVNVISYQGEIMSQPPNAQAALLLGRGSVGLSVKTFSNLIRAGTAASMQAQWRASFCHSANQRYGWRWCKTRRGSVFSWSLQHRLTAENGGIKTISHSPSAATLLYAQLQFMSNERCRNYCLWLIKHRRVGYYFMGHWAQCLFKGLKYDCHTFELPLDCLIMSRHFCKYEAKVISLLWKSERCCHAIAIVFKLQKARCESWPSYPLKRYHIFEYLCHHTSLISGIYHSWGSLNSFWACTMMIMPFVFSETVKGSKTYWNGYCARWHGGLGFSTIAARCCVRFPFSREWRARRYMSDQK